MNRKPNPFYIIEDTVCLLNSLGADPLTQGDPSWQEHIISLNMNRMYDIEGNHEYTMDIHLTPAGFDILRRSLNEALVPNVRRMSYEYNQVTIRLREYIRVFMLDLIPEEDR